MDYLLDLEIVGSRISIYGDKKGILTIIIEHKNEVKYSYRMRKEGFFDLLKLLKSQIQVGVEVKDSMNGVHAVHEILIQNTQIDEKVKHDNFPIEKVIDKDGVNKKCAVFSCIEVKGVGANHYQIIRLYAINLEEKEWRIGVDVHGYIKKGDNKRQTEKLEIQQDLLVEIFANTSLIMQHIDNHYKKKKEESESHH